MIGCDNDDYRDLLPQAINHPGSRYHPALKGQVKDGESASTGVSAPSKQDISMRLSQMLHRKTCTRSNILGQAYSNIALTRPTHTRIQRYTSTEDGDGTHYGPRDGRRDDTQARRRRLHRVENIPAQRLWVSLKQGRQSVESMFGIALKTHGEQAERVGREPGVRVSVLAF